MAQYTKGYREEIPDSTPVELPIGYKEPESLEQVIARMIYAADFQKAREVHGVESIEESDDFDVEEDPDFTSEHEMSVMQEESPLRFVQESGVDQRREVSGEDGRESKVKNDAGKRKKRADKDRKDEESEEEVAET